MYFTDDSLLPENHPAAQGGCGHIHAGEWEEKVEVVKVASAND